MGFGRGWVGSGGVWWGLSKSEICDGKSLDGKNVVDKIEKKNCTDLDAILKPNDIRRGASRDDAVKPHHVTFRHAGVAGNLPEVGLKVLFRYTPFVTWCPF